MCEKGKGQRPILRGCRGGKIFTAFPVQRNMTCLSQVEIIPVNLISIYSIHLLCEPYCVVSAQSSSRLRQYGST